jgi:hypothetical protein
MKNIFILFLMLVTCIAFGQKKKDKEKDAQAKMDTLTKANHVLADSNKKLTAKSDSISKELEKYFGVYTVIKNKVMKKNFDPSRMSKIIDSLRTGRDSAINLSGASKKQLQDSIKRFRHVNDSLRKDVEGLRYAVNLLKGQPNKSPSAPTDFTGSWSLILRKVKIIGQSPRTGIVDASADPANPKATSFLENNRITGITFLDKEFAEMTFASEEKSKCYFVISDFSKTNPYYIDFKGTKADFRMYFTNTLIGTRISFQIPDAEGTYYFGEMTR